MHLAIANLVVGILLLLFGRKLFWIFVGLAGFMTGLDLANRYLAGAQTTKLVIALLVGIIGAVLAIIFYKAAVAIAGFLIGGYLAVEFVRYLGIVTAPSLTWVPYLIGGIIGTVLILVLFDWTLIVLSSFSGAALILRPFTLPRIHTSVVFIALVIIGIVVQAGILLSFRRTHA